MANETLENGLLKFGIDTTSGGSCWFVKGLVSSTEIYWLMDAGVSHNVTDVKTYYIFAEHDRPCLLPPSSSFQSADGGALIIHVEIDLVVAFEPSCVELRAVVAELDNFKAILGIQFLEKHKCVMDLENGCLFAPEFQINLVKHESVEYSVLQTLESISLPQGMKWQPWHTLISGLCLNLSW